MPKTAEEHRPDRFLRINEVLSRLKICRQTWINWRNNGKAPKGYKITSKITVWRESDIEDFRDQLLLKASSSRG